MQGAPVRQEWRRVVPADAVNGQQPKMPASVVSGGTQKLNSVFLFRLSAVNSPPQYLTVV